MPKLPNFRTDRFKSGLLSNNPIAPTGFDITRIPLVNIAIQRVLDRLYEGIPYPTAPVISEHFSKSQRNEQLRLRYAAGENITDLAREFNLTVQRVFQIINRRQH